MPDALVRVATNADAAVLQTIYAHHVANGTATFDTVAPDAAFWAGKIEAVLARGWPFLVVARADAVKGFAYATRFRDRAAYAHTCENSIYIADGSRGAGLGSVLLGALVVEARDCGFAQMIAVIGGGEPASVALHAKLGFREAGRMRDVGRKFGRLLDTVYMQRALVGEGA